MQKILINALNESFESKKIVESNNKEQKFLWNQNFHKIEIQKIRQEIQIYQRNSKKSRSSYLNYLFWKKGELRLAKKALKYQKKLECIFLKKSLLTIRQENDQPIKFLSDNKSQMILDDFKMLIIKQKDLIRNIKNDYLQASLDNSYLTKIKLFNFYIEISKHFTILLPKIKLLVEKASQLEGFTSKNQKASQENINQAQKKIKLKLKKTKKQIFTRVKKNYHEIWQNKHLTFFDKISILPQLILSTYRFEKGKRVSLLYQEWAKHNYDIQYKEQKAKIYEQYEIKIIDDIFKFSKNLSNLRMEQKSSKFNKSKQEQYHLQLKKLKKEFKNKWSKKVNVLKASSASKRAKKVAWVKNKNNYQINKRELKLALITKASYANDISTFKNKFKQQLKYQKKIRENALKDLNLKIPVEFDPKNYWISIILGSLFPGVGSLFVRKYVKGIIQIILSIITILTLAWIFGAFPSASGNGILGLLNLGYDASVANETIIGITNGKPNDARFYLVLGALAIILLIVVIMYYLISILDNINQNNLARIGVRSSHWKEQKKLLKTTGLPYLLSLPAFIFIIFIVLLPLLATILISFTNFGQKVWDAENQVWLVANGVTNPISWVGDDQFNTIFKVMGAEFKDVLIWTLIWTFGASFTLIIIGTFFAIIVNQNRIKFKNVFRVIYILPWAVPAFVTIMYFSIFFKHDGIFNNVFGLTTDWSSAGYKTKILMIMLQGWLGHSYIFLLITGMLQSIPKSLYEASRIDGASSWYQFRTVTAPIIIGQIAPLLIGQFTFNFNNFGLIYLFNGGGTVQAGKTAGAQDIFISWIYKLINSGDNTRPGAAAAMSLVISVFTITPSAFLFVRSRSFRKGA